MFFQKKTGDDPEQFWREYGEQHGETVLAYALGQYVSGWAEYDMSFWGLLIATSGGFRIHHFPHESWIQALSRTTMGGKPPQEKTIFVPREIIVSAELRVEKSWWKRVVFASQPQLIVRYRNAEGTEAELTALTETRAEAIVQALGS